MDCFRHLYCTFIVNSDVTLDKYAFSALFDYQALAEQFLIGNLVNSVV